MFSLNRNGVYGGKSISLAWRDNYKYGQHISYDKSTDGKSSRSTLIDGQKIGGLIAIGAFAAVFVKFLVLISKYLNFVLVLFVFPIFCWEPIIGILFVWRFDYIFCTICDFLLSEYVIDLLFYIYASRIGISDSL